MRRRVRCRHDGIRDDRCVRRLRGDRKRAVGAGRTLCRRSNREHGCPSEAEELGRILGRGIARSRRPRHNCTQGRSPSSTTCACQDHEHGDKQSRPGGSQVNGTRGGDPRAHGRSAPRCRRAAGSPASPGRKSRRLIRVPLLAHWQCVRRRSNWPRLRAARQGPPGRSSDCWSGRRSPRPRRVYRCPRSRQGARHGRPVVAVCDRATAASGWKGGGVSRRDRRSGVAVALVASGSAGR